MLGNGLFAELSTHRLGVKASDGYAATLSQVNLQEVPDDQLGLLAKLHNPKLTGFPVHDFLADKMQQIRSKRAEEMEKKRKEPVPTTSPRENEDVAAKEPENTEDRCWEVGDKVKISAKRQKLLYDGALGIVKKVMKNKLRVELTELKEQKDFEKTACTWQAPPKQETSDSQTEKPSKPSLSDLLGNH